MTAEHPSRLFTEFFSTPQNNDVAPVSPVIPERTTHSVTPIPRENYFVHGNGIDIKSGRFANGRGTDYERECFKKITSVNNKKNSLILGPHFIDEVFSQAFSGKVRPDAIQFNTENEDVWVLSTLYEFKSGNLNGPVRKLQGFANLLNHMREDKEKLPSVLKAALPWAQDALPNRIIVPSEKNVSVIFLSPELTHKVIYDAKNPQFPVSHVHFIENPPK